jgi:hypothetical protein
MEEMNVVGCEIRNSYGDDDLRRLCCYAVSTGKQRVT